MSTTSRRHRGFTAVLAACVLLLGGCSLLDPEDGQPPPKSLPTATTTSTSAPTTTAEGDALQAVADKPIPPAEHLDPEGIGDIGVGYDIETVQASGLVGEETTGCEAGAVYLPLRMQDVTGFVILKQDRVAAIIVHAGSVADGGTVGQPTVEFAAQSAGHYDWSVDTSTEAEQGTWLGTLTERGTGLAIKAEVDPTTDSVLSVATPYVPTC